VLYNNASLDDNNWLKVRLEGRISNRDAYGSKVKVTAGELVLTQLLVSGSGYYSTNARELYFGLGRNKRIAQIEVTWPSGQVQTFKPVNPNQTVYIVEGEQLHENSLVLAVTATL
ncbi:MAG: ASPIC/UnbV domain-containing protein, partial [Candidatus Marinimicrobia bacterium]|nr:ASPIC/UnbV domain-containing protein [Candidatus Neomarinimicrobiota bacterium]